MASFRSGLDMTFLLSSTFELTDQTRETRLAQDALVATMKVLSIAKNALAARSSHRLSDWIGPIDNAGVTDAPASRRSPAARGTGGDDPHGDSRRAGGAEGDVGHENVESPHSRPSRAQRSSR